MEAESNLAASPVSLQPGVDSSYSHAWKHLWKHFGVLLLIVIIYFVISLVPNVYDWIFPEAGLDPVATLGMSSITGIVSLAYALLITNPLGYGINFAYLNAAREERVEVNALFEAFRRNYWNAVLANLLVFIIVAVGFVLLIVPGIIFVCKLMFVPFLVVDKEMDAIKAIKTSWRMTKGHAGTIFLMGLLGIPVTIAGLICLGVGVIVSMMLIGMAFASLYHAVSGEQEAAAQPIEA